MDTTTERLANVLRSLNALYTFHELFPYSAKQVTEALAEYDAALKQQPRHEGAEDARDGALWRAGVKHGEFPELCGHDDTQPGGFCWYTPMYRRPFSTAEEAMQHFIEQRERAAIASERSGT